MLHHGGTCSEILVYDGFADTWQRRRGFGRSIAETTGVFHIFRFFFLSFLALKLCLEKL